jgi:hypothetical protein
MQRRTQATFERWWGQLLPGTQVVSFSPLLPQLRVAADGSALEFVPESVSLAPSSEAQQLQASEAQQPAEPAPLHEQQGVWPVQRCISLLLGEVPRLRDDDNGYGPRGRDFIDHVDIPGEVEDAWARLAGRYPQLLRA